MVKSLELVRKQSFAINEPSSPNSHQKAWQVLKSAFVLSLLGKFFVRDFFDMAKAGKQVSPLRDWEDVPMRGFSTLVSMVNVC